MLVIKVLTAGLVMGMSGMVLAANGLEGRLVEHNMHQLSSQAEVMGDYYKKKRIDNRLDRRGDRIDYRLDRKGDRINNRLDRRAERAAANGHGKLANHLDRKGNRIEHRLDRRGDRINHRLDRVGNR